MRLHAACRALLPALLFASCGERGVSITNASIEEAARATSGTTRQRAGEWETTTRIVSVEMPKAAPALVTALKQQIGQPKVTTTCVTAELAARPGFGIIAPLTAATCRFARLKMAGGKLESVKSCTTGGATASIRNWGSYAAEHYDIYSAVSRGGAAPSALTVRLTSRRTGDCKPGAAGKAA